MSNLLQEIKVPPREEALAASEAPRRRRVLRYVSAAILLLLLLGGAGLAAVDAQQLIDFGLPRRVAKLAAVPGEKVRGLMAAVGTGSGNKPDAKPTGREAVGTTDGAGKADGAAARPEPRQDNASGDMAAKMEQMRQATERENRTLAAKLDRMAERLDALERQFATAAVAPAAQPAPKPAARPVALPAQPSGPEAKPTPRPAAGDAKLAAKPNAGEPKPGAAEAKPGAKAVANWKVREVMDGIAILEGPPGFIRVSRGDRVPGVGWVQSMQRQGNGWTVTTSNGVISPK